MVDKLAARMKEQPDDAEGWTMLARSYTVLGRFAEALPAYARAAELQPNNAVAARRLRRRRRGDQAHRQQPEVDRADRARADDRPEASEGARPRRHRRLRPRRLRRRDRRLAEARRPAAARAASSRRSVAGEHRRGARQARRRRRRAPAPPAAGAGAARAAAPASAATRRRRARSVSGTVTLDPALAAQAAPGDTVFVFARAAERRPHAARGAARAGQRPAARASSSTTAWRWRRA